MERLIIDTGGRPMKNEDLTEYLQAFSILEQWFNELDFGDCIVYGCDITGTVGNYTVSAGVIYYNDELRVFDGVAGVAFPLLLEPEDIDINSRLYEDGNNKYTAQIFKMVPDVAGSLSFDLDTPRAREALFGADLKFKLVDIGDWDMDATASVFVAHGLGDYKRIREITVYIFSDDDASGPVLGGYILSAPLSAAVTEQSGGVGKVSDSLIELIRKTSGQFDTTDFNTTSFNRGYIKITYVD